MKPTFTSVKPVKAAKFSFRLKAPVHLVQLVKNRSQTAVALTVQLAFTKTKITNKFVSNVMSLTQPVMVVLATSRA
jgi:hypothetical protein